MDSKAVYPLDSILRCRGKYIIESQLEVKKHYSEDHGVKVTLLFFPNEPNELETVCLASSFEIHYLVT